MSQLTKAEREQAAADARKPSDLVLQTLAVLDGDRGNPHWPERYALTETARNAPPEHAQAIKRLALGLLADLMEGHSEVVSAGKNGLRLAQLNQWYKRDPEFEALCVEAQLRGLEVDERCLLRERAKGNWKVAHARLQAHPRTRETWMQPTDAQKDRGITIVMNWSRDGDKASGPETVTIEPTRGS